MSLPTRRDVEEACITLWHQIPQEVKNSGDLEALLDELEEDHAGALAEWCNRRTLTLEDVVELCGVSVERLVCDNCGEAEYRCYPPNGNWDHFQGCCRPYDIGATFETSKGEVFVCTDCYQRNPAFQMLQ